MSRKALLALLAVWLQRPGVHATARKALATTDAQALAGFARRHGVAAVTLKAATQLELGEEQLAALRNAARAEAARSLRLEPALEELGAQSKQRGIRAVLVKGLALDRGVYPNPGLRPAADLDLLIDAQQRDAWEQLFALLGYEKFPHVDRTWRRPDGATLDLHEKSSDLVGVIDVPDHMSPVRLDLAGIFERAVEVEGLALPAPCAEDHIILCAAHGLGVHVYERLMWLLDVVVLLGKSEPAQLVKLARAAGAGRLLFDSLELALELGLLEPDVAFLDELRPANRGRLEKKLLRRLAAGPLPDRSEFLLALAMPAPSGYKRELIKRALLPSGRTVSHGKTAAGSGTAAHFARAARLAWLATFG
jgi:Uncharacterised nucleotidyltransferase